jgi:hypothetical protein
MYKYPTMADKVFDRCTFIIRQFQPKDTPQVHALMLEGLVYGSEWTIIPPLALHLAPKVDVSRHTL